MSQQMTHKEFCLWLEGFFMRGGETPTAEQWQMIGVRLQKVLNPAQAVNPKDYGRTISVSMKDIMDECEQGGLKKELMPKTLQEMLDQVKIGPLQYVPPFTPQAPFKGEGY